MRSVYFCSVLVLNGLLSLTYAKDDNRETTELRADAAQESRRRALDAAIQGKMVESEDVLARLSQATKNSAAWYSDLAFNWVRLAFQARAIGDERTAEKGARRALNAIEKAEAGYVNEPLRLSVLMELRGVISEQFVGSAEDAKTYYRQATQLAPKSPALREVLERKVLARSTPE